MKQVLIVEDHPDHAFLLQEILTREMYLTTTTTNIFVVLEMLKKQQVCLILLDISMPEMSGDMMIREIRRIDNDVPIIMTTCDTNEQMKINCLNLGANYYMVKPILVKDLTRFLDNLEL